MKKSLLRFMLDFMTFQHPMLKLYKVQLSNYLKTYISEAENREMGMTGAWIPAPAYAGAGSARE